VTAGPDPEPPDPGAGSPGGEPAVPAWVRAGRLMDGFLTTQLLYVAAKLGVADVLAAGPRKGRSSPGPSARTRTYSRGCCGGSRGCCGGWCSRTCWPRWTGGRFALTELG